MSTERTGSRVMTGVRCLLALVLVGMAYGAEPRVAIALVDGVASESGDTALFRLTRSGDADSALSVDIALSGSAVAGNDYQDPGATVAFAAGVHSTDLLIRPLDDRLDEGDTPETVIVELQAGSGYILGDTRSAMASIADNDTAGLVLGELSGPTREADGSATPQTVTVALSCQPSDDVVVNLDSSDASEAVVDTDLDAGYQQETTLFFTAGNWSTPQSVQVFAVDDDYDDGNVPFRIRASVASDAPAIEYRGVPVASIGGTCEDDDTAGVVVPQATIVVHEDAHEDATYANHFTLRLSSCPYAPVLLEVTSSDPGEIGIASTGRVVRLDEGNWRGGVSVALVPRQDDLVDGPQELTLAIAPARSGDRTYAGMGGWSLAARCDDDDTVGLEFHALLGVNGEPFANEGQDYDAFYRVRLASRPTAPVTLTLSVAADGPTGQPQVRIDTAPDTPGRQTSIGFTGADWNLWRTVALEAVLDGVEEAPEHPAIVAHRLVRDGDGQELGDFAYEITLRERDEAGLLIKPASDRDARIDVLEGFTGTAFQVALTRRPRPDTQVVIALECRAEELDDVAFVREHLTLSPAKLTFTPADWDQPKPVIVTHSADADTRSASFDIGMEAHAETTDPSYYEDDSERVIDGAYARAVDAGERGVFVDRVGAVAVERNLGMQLAEGQSGTVAYRLRLTGGAPAADETVTVRVVPDADVTVDTSSDDPGVQDTLTFTNADWTDPRTVTVSVVDDHWHEDTPHIAMVRHRVESDGTSFGEIHGELVAPVAVAIEDDDPQRLAVSDAGAVRVTEQGGRGVFTLGLQSRPYGQITVKALVPISVQDECGILDPTGTVVDQLQLVYGPDSWQPRVMTLVGLDDDSVDGDQAFTVHIDVVDNTDENDNLFHFAHAKIPVVVADDDQPGLVFDRDDGRTPGEDGGARRYRVKLATRPLADVTVELLTDGQSTVSPTTHTFASADWEPGDAVMIDVRAVDDDVAEGDHPTHIVHAISAAGEDYRTLAPVTRVITLADDDTPGLVIRPFPDAAGLQVAEDGSRAGGYAVRLASQPTTNVTVAVSTPDGDEIALGSSLLQFDPLTWSDERMVPVTGVDDPVDDDDADAQVDFSIYSGDSGYNGLSASVSCITIDDDSAGIAFAAPDGLEVAENGATATLTVSLTSRPQQPVSLRLVSSVPDEAVPEVSELFFDAGNWNRVQTVRILPRDDDIDDGAVPFAIAIDQITSDDADYAALGTALADGSVSYSVAGENADDDGAGVILSHSAFALVEGGAAEQLSVRLASRPTGIVELLFTGLDATEVAVDPARLRFGPDDWDQEQPVAVAPVDDDRVDGDQATTLNVSIDAGTSVDATYIALNDAGVYRGIPTVVHDDDRAGVVLTPAGSHVNESGTAIDIGVVLTSRPADPVTLTVTGLPGDEAVASATELAFPVESWNEVQTLTVTGVDDADIDGTQSYELRLEPSSADADYADLPAPALALHTDDNDAPGVTIAQSDGQTVVDEHGGEDSYSIVLHARPESDVTITATPDTQVLLAGAADPVALVFTPADWDVPQSVTVSAVADASDETTEHPANITHAIDGPPGYAALSVPAVAVTVIDDDPPAITGSLAATCGRSGAIVLAPELLGASDDHAQLGDLRFELQLAPGQGELRVDGMALVAGERFALQAVHDGAVVYAHSGGSTTTDGFAIAAIDDREQVSAGGVFTITVSGFVAPTIESLSGGGTFTEGDAPMALVTSLQITDTDSTHFSNGSLRVSLGADVRAEEILAVRHGGDAPGQIGVSGSEIRYGGTVIGSANGGVGADLVIGLTGGAACDAAAVQELIKSITYCDTGDDPGANPRSVSFTLTDDTGTQSQPVALAVAVVGVNDPPILTVPALVVTPAGAATLVPVSVRDPDDESLTPSLSAAPGKGVVLGMPDAIASTATLALTYRPADAQSGADSFSLRVVDAAGAATEVEVPVAIVSSGAPRPWVVSNPPLFIAAGGLLSYPLALDTSALAEEPAMSWSVRGTLPQGVTAVFNNSGLREPTLTLTVEETVTAGFLRFDLVGVDTANRTATVQPILLVVQTGTGGAG